MQVTLPEEALPATLRLNPELHMSDDEYYEFCMANPEVFFERTAEGEIVIAPPVGLESNDREVDIASELRQWAKRDRRGRAYGISAEFILPTGAAYAPDAAWVSNERLSRLTKEQKRKFPPLCPEFVVEVMSPSDRLKDAQKKCGSGCGRASISAGSLTPTIARYTYTARARASRSAARKSKSWRVRDLSWDLNWT